MWFLVWFDSFFSSRAPGMVLGGYNINKKLRCGQKPCLAPCICRQTIFGSDCCRVCSPRETAIVRKSRVRFLIANFPKRNSFDPERFLGTGKWVHHAVRSFLEVLCDVSGYVGVRGCCCTVSTSICTAESMYSHPKRSKSCRGFHESQPTDWAWFYSRVRIHGRIPATVPLFKFVFLALNM